MVRPRGRNLVTEKGLTNEQVVVLALSSLGGNVNLVDTEDVAIKADEIAPGRFRWRKHTQFINIELVHTALRDAKRLGGLVRGAGSKGWQLTSEGLAMVAELENQGTVSIQHRRRVDQKEKVWVNRERARLLSEDAFVKLQSDGLKAITRREIDRFFRLDDYVTGEMRKARIQRILNAFSDDPELSDGVSVLAKRAEEQTS